MARKSMITVAATINGITLTRKGHKISFSALKAAKGESDFISDLITEESLIEVSIAYQGTEQDGFPPITCECGIKGFGIKKTVDKPEFVNMKFSGNQIDQLRNIMDSEAEIDLKITKKQGTFNFTEPEPEEE